MNRNLPFIRALTFAVFLFFFSISPSICAADGSIAKIKKVVGDVEIRSGGTMLTPSEGQDLSEGDIVKTGGDGNLSLLFVDGTQLSIGPDSNMVVNRYLFVPKKKTYAFNMKLNKGSAIYSSGRLAKLSPESVKIQTPQMTIGVRGTKFLVSVD